MSLKPANSYTVRSFVISIILFAVALTFSGCGDDPTGPDFSNVPPPFDTTQAVSKTELSNGLIIYVIEEGHGVFEVVEKDFISVFLTGRTKDGRIFDSSYRGGSDAPKNFSNLTPVPKRAGFSTTPPLMEGLRQGLLGMVVGEKRTIVVPPSLGWEPDTGGIDSTVVDLDGKTLVFDVELSSIL